MNEKIAIVIGLLLASCAKMQDLSPTNTTDAIVKCGNQTCLRLTLDNDYGLRFTIGTPPKNIKLMPAFHTHRTFVTSNQCLRCKNKAFDPNNSTTDEDGNPAPLRYLEYLFDHYGVQNDGFLLTGEPKRDKFCIRQFQDKTESDICTDPGRGHEFFSIWDFQHNENLTFFEELPFDGLLGIGPAETRDEKNHSFTYYLH